MTIVSLDLRPSCGKFATELDILTANINNEVVGISVDHDIYRTAVKVCANDIDFD